MANQQRPKSLLFKSLLKLQLLGQAQHVVRSLNNAKSMVAQLLNKKKTERKARNKKNLNWKSSAVTRRDAARNDSTTILGEEGNEMTESEQNSEEEEEDSERDEEEREIDRLAEKFIASCHEKFRLEKQESFRRYQEMLARSI